MNERGLTDLEDIRLVYRGNNLMQDLFRKGVHSIRQATGDEASAKGAYRFLRNDRVGEEDLVGNFSDNCKAACRGRYVVCIQDSSEINLSGHSGRINKDSFVGTTNANKDKGLGFFIHPSLVLDAVEGIPYGYADIRIWNRPLEFESKSERGYTKLPIEAKESYKWIEASRNTQSALSDVVAGMVIVQDREGDIYDQYATVPDGQTDLLVRAAKDRTLADKQKLFGCLSHEAVQGTSEVTVDARNGRKRRTARLEVKYKEVTLARPKSAGGDTPESLKLYLVEALEAGCTGRDKISRRLLTTVRVTSMETALCCIEWYSWRWTIEEVFKVLKKEGYDIESSELEYGASVRKLCLLILEVIIKLFLMRLAYAEPERELSADSCFSQEEQEFLEHQTTRLEGRTEKQKNPYERKDLKRCVWVIARLGGWKGYESKRHPGITTLWTGLKLFDAAFQGWMIHRDVSTR
ncbi:MAG: IS4 family transposase [Chitinophagaceae bacterium]